MSLMLVMYAVLTLQSTDQTMVAYSWGITFNQRTECVAYFEKNSANVLNGLLEFGKGHYDTNVIIEEAGCAIVDAADKDNPKMIRKHPVYQPDSA